MTLLIETFVLGPIENNTYVAADPVTRQAVIIDPSFESHTVVKWLQQKGLELAQVWLTHAHFDHIAGINEILQEYPSVPVALHPDDLALWQSGGGAAMFGMRLKPSGDPTLFLEHGQPLAVGDETVEVRHTPGHTRGHVIFYAVDSQLAFCGDLIFLGSVGRTDLPGGSHQQLLESIRSQVQTLPPATRLLSGHGPETTVADETRSNPFLT